MKMPPTPEQAAWFASQGLDPATGKPRRASTPKPERPKLEYRDLTSDEDTMLACLKSQVTFPIGCWDKRFVRGMGRRITESGATQLRRIFHRYRRQIRHDDKERLLSICEP